MQDSSVGVITPFENNSTQLRGWVVVGGNTNFGNYRRRNVFTEVPNLKASWSIRPESMK